MTTTRRSPRRVLSEDERAEKRAAEREQMQAAIEALRTSEGWKRWLKVRRHFHTYTFHNQLLIASQCPEATRVAGFRSWLSIGYAVRKGERAIRIWAPCPPSKRQLAEWKRAVRTPLEKPSTYFRLVAVFDRSQVDPVPDFPGGAVELDPPSEPIDGAALAPLFQPLAEFGASIGSPISVAEIPGPAEGYYEPSTKKIRIQPVSPSFSANAQVSVGIHELAHALVRHDHQDDDPRLTYAEEEVIAEAVAYTVCSTVGLDTSGSSIPYLADLGRGSKCRADRALRRPHRPSRPSPRGRRNLSDSRRDPHSAIACGRIASAHRPPTRLPTAGGIGMTPGCDLGGDAINRAVGFEGEP